ncbi:hypothetical protein A7K93_10475, partial [Candidatus Methylacidiphilum fumarolicum]
HKLAKTFQATKSCGHCVFEDLPIYGKVPSKELIRRSIQMRKLGASRANRFSGACGSFSLRAG